LLLLCCIAQCCVCCSHLPDRRLEEGNAVVDVEVHAYEG
jgi:sulfur relay (sulfurtransferase) DsrF/TusC family protein